MLYYAIKYYSINYQNPLEFTCIKGYKYMLYELTKQFSTTIEIISNEDVSDASSNWRSIHRLLQNILVAIRI